MAPRRRLFHSTRGWDEDQAISVNDPARHRRSGSALGLAHEASLHPAFVGARQRGRGAALCPSRANAQDGKDVAAEHRRRADADTLWTPPNPPPPPPPPPPPHT